VKEVGDFDPNFDPNWFDVCSLTSRYNVRLLREWCGGRILLTTALVRLRDRLFGRSLKFEPAVSYHGLLVFDREDLNGGGLWQAQNYSRALLELGVGPCERVFDFCSGPGYIGYYLLASGYCKTLAMSDINPVAMDVARYTASYNRIEDIVSTYISDVLQQIPESEKWDLVVGNLPIPERDVSLASNIVDYDVSGTLHQRFYGSVGKFMKPGGLILMLNTRKDSSPEYFRPMIEEGGGQIVQSMIQKDFRGVESDRYWLLSRW
jgi:Methyltransferase small domain